MVTLAAVLVGLATSGRAASTPQFTIVDLGTLGGSYSYAYDINESGQVVGMSTTAAGDQHAFIWTKAGGMVDLGALVGAPSRAYDVTDSGQVVGYFTVAGGGFHPFSWTAAGGMIDLDPGPYGAWSIAYSVNEAGQVTGQIRGRAFLWAQAGGMVYLPTLGGAVSAAFEINAHGTVVGESQTGSGQNHAFSWSQARGMVDLGTLGGSDSRASHVTDGGSAAGWSLDAGGIRRAVLWPSTGGIVDLGTLGGPSTSSNATDLLDSGQVVGWSYVSNDANHAFMWTQATGMIDLGTLGGPASSASDITNRSQIVGSSYIDLSQMHAFSWTQAAGMIDLGTLGGTSFAVKANDKGQVVGGSVTPTGDQHAVLWNPVVDTTPPEITVPADITVNANGLAGAVVTFAITATDDVDGAVPVTCAPETGSMFSIGNTLVTCTAADSAGNEASATFTVIVRGAATQLRDLRAAVDGVGPGTSLADKLEDAQAAHTAGDTPRTCEILTAFVNQVNAQSGKGIEADTATTLIADATRIRAVLGC